jgi:hypothetical protein
LSDVGSSLRFMLVYELRGSCWTTRCCRVSVRSGVTSSVGWVVWRGYGVVLGLVASCFLELEDGRLG